MDIKKILWIMRISNLMNVVLFGCAAASGFLSWEGSIVQLFLACYVWYVLKQQSPTSTTNDSLAYHSAPILASLSLCLLAPSFFAFLLCAFELRTNLWSKYFEKLFGFMYSFWGRALFLCL